MAATNLEQAIELGICIGPLSNIHIRLRNEITDYLAQEFMRFLGKTENTHDKALLKEFFEKVVGAHE